MYKLISSPVFIGWSKTILIYRTLRPGTFCVEFVTHLLRVLRFPPIVQNMLVSLTERTK